MTILTKNQTKTFGPRTDAQLVATYGQGAILVAQVRYDDDCGNGHNSFAITGEVSTPASRRWRGIAALGCLHQDIARLFPELAPFIKWHLTSSDGPLHYIDNTLYWLGWHGWCDGKPTSPPNLQHARECALWADLPESFLVPEGYRIDKDSKIDPSLYAPIEQALRERLPALMDEFRAAVESLGFTY